LGFTALAGSPGDFGKLVADETEKWGKSSELPAPRLTEPFIERHS
jgi:hypothetical protein